MRIAIAARLLALWAFFGVAPGAQAQTEDVVIASWNIQHLGNKQGINYEALAYVASRFDLIAVQEVMNEVGLERFRQALEVASEERWEALASHLVGRGGYKEMYAFVWRPSRVEYVDGAVVYVDERDQFEREPFAARFRAADGSHEWVMANLHVLFGRSAADRTPELEALPRLWDWVREVFPQAQNLILAGDFNMAPSSPAFDGLKQRARPLIAGGASTLSTINGRYANLYDNLWLGHGHGLSVIEAGIEKFPQRMGWSHNAARQSISDHAPVYVRIAASGPFAARHIPERMPLPTVSDSKAQPLLRGNRKSRIYHHTDCPGYSEIAPHNRVPFNKEGEAVDAGYRRARNCEW